jgi:hypothetical protein
MNCRSQSYDNASNMSGIYKGVQVNSMIRGTMLKISITN